MTAAHTVHPPAGSLSRVPNPGNDSSLAAVTCISKRRCWAVGWTLGAGGEKNEALRWNGASWSVTRTPDPGTAYDKLDAVACASRSSCWAVGIDGDSIFDSHAEALHWDGSRWLAAPLPSFGATTADQLVGVACASVRNCWAVGSHTSAASISRNMALHWNGASWSVTVVPNPGQRIRFDIRQLNGVTCVASANCWAVGEYSDKAPHGPEALHWNGKRWSLTASPLHGGGSGVACTSAISCSAVGSGAMRWNGIRWRQERVPQSASDSNDPVSVACVSAADCWAVGTLNRTYPEGGSAELTDALHWNGTRWSRVPTANPGGTAHGTEEAINELMGVVCTAKTSCWAVGDYWDNAATAHRNIAFHWNGKTWSSA